jgi:hypothetical protein
VGHWGEKWRYKEGNKRRENYVMKLGWRTSELRSRTTSSELEITRNR